MNIDFQEEISKLPYNCTECKHYNTRKVTMPIGEDANRTMFCNEIARYVIGYPRTSCNMLEPKGTVTMDDVWEELKAYNREYEELRFKMDNHVAKLRGVILSLREAEVKRLRNGKPL